MLNFLYFNSSSGVATGEFNLLPAFCFSQISRYQLIFLWYSSIYGNYIILHSHFTFSIIILAFSLILLCILESSYLRQELSNDADSNPLLVYLRMVISSTVWLTEVNSISTSSNGNFE